MDSIYNSCDVSSEKYEVVGYNVPCRRGGEVTSEKECQAAAKDVGLKFGNAFESKRQQRYCFRLGPRIYFNRDSSMAQGPQDRLRPLRAVCVKDPGGPSFK